LAGILLTAEAVAGLTGAFFWEGVVEDPSAQASPAIARAAAKVIIIRMV
jgi:hypothetical protein